MTSIEGPVVLVVGGWSPGPLVYLDSVVASRSCIVVEPRTLPMPPFPSGSWCCHPRMLMSIAVCGVFLWLACIQHDSILWKFLAILATLVSFRMMAAVAVRTSIQVAAQSCLEAIRSYNENAVVLVGFSWGGAVRFCCLCGGRRKDLPNLKCVIGDCGAFGTAQTRRSPQRFVDCTHNSTCVINCDAK